MAYKTLDSAVSNGSRLEILITLRSKIAKTIDTTDSGRDIAALSKRLVEVQDEIDALSKPTDKKQGKLVEMQAKSKARNASA